jgi:hypothetical protein
MTAARDGSAEHLAASARARGGALRDELTQRDVDRQAAGERLAEHDAQRAAAEQFNDAQHALALEAARVDLRDQPRPLRVRVANWVIMLPTGTLSASGRVR